MQKRDLASLTNDIATQKLAMGLLYDSHHFQNFGILTVPTSESAKVSDFSPHIMFAAN